MADAWRTRLASAVLPAAGALGIATAMILGGCATPVEQPRMTVPPASPSAQAPIFESDEEALAAATEAYAKYLAMSDLIASEGGVNPERIEAVASGAALEGEMESFRQFQLASARSVGNTKFDNVTLQSAIYDEPQTFLITMYVCNDVSGVDVLGAAQETLVSADRLPRVPFEIEFDYDVGGNLLVSSRHVWTGINSC